MIYEQKATCDAARFVSEHTVGFDQWARSPTSRRLMYLRSRHSTVTRLLHTSLHTQGHWDQGAQHSSLGNLSLGDQMVVPHRNRAGRYTDTQKYGRTIGFRPRKSTGRFMRPARSGAAPGAGGGRPTHRPRFSSARLAVITAIWPLLTSSLKFFVDFYS